MSNLDLVILGLLRKKPRHGYEIFSITGKYGMDNWLKVKKPSVYKALRRLEEQGHISGEFIKDENHPPRKVYKIQASGSEYFMELLENILYEKFPCNKADFWNALRFVQGNLTRVQFLKVIETRKERMLKWQKNVQKKLKEARDNDEFENQPFIAKIMREQFQSFFKIEYKTLKKMEDAAKLEENSKDFAEKKLNLEEK